MEIEILTTWYNEEFLAPFFLKHYNYVDRIYVLLDSDTDDKTRDILASHNTAYGNIEIEEFTFPDMMDDTIKAKNINRVLKTIESDWVYVLDADEFIFPCGFEDPIKFLNIVDGDVVMARMWQVYRHIDDTDLNIDEPVIFQRRHGDPNRETGINAAYNKPIVLKTPIQYDMLYGNHAIIGDNYKMATKYFDGSHWAMADKCFAIERRLKGRKERQSKHNLETGMTYQHHNISEKTLLEEIDLHKNDPKLF